MKKLLYIFSLVLLAGACTLDQYQPETSGDGSDKVTMSFSVSVPEAQSMTRAMADKPALETMHAIVFDRNGFLVEYVNATNLVKATENATDYTFSIALSISDTQRRVHFVGNCPAAPKFGMESEVMAALQTSENADAYWYRVEVPAIKADNTDGEGPYAPAPQTINDFGKIMLTRNFAKVVVESKTDDFKLDSWAVAGTPKVGSVAPYNRNTKQFQSYVGKTFADLRSEQYDAFVPVTASPDFNLAEADLKGSAAYVYERETPVSGTNPAYVIVKGTYGGETCYYKIDLRDEKGNYFPILRNFQYKITINSVTRKGSASLEAAMKGPGSGDVSSAVEYESLTNISDGEARLSVEYTSKVLVSSVPIGLKVKFDAIGSGVKLSNPPAVTINDDAGTSGAAINDISAASAPDANGWYSFTITPTELGTSAKRQSLTVKGTYTLNGETKYISRKVEYVLMPRLKMSAVCDPDEIIKTQGTAFDLCITIPDALSEAMFPLAFKIEAENLTITPGNDSMPVESGESTIPGSTRKSSFWFVKTLSYEDYSALELDPEHGTRTFRCHFKSNTAISATQIYVSNDYFEQADCPLGNYDPSYFTDLAFNKAKYPTNEGEAVTFTFSTSGSIPESGYITVTLTGLEPADPETGNLRYLRTDADGNGVFALDSTGLNASYTLNLVTIDEESDLNVKLEAYHFITSEKSATRDIVMYDFVNPTFPDRVNYGTNQTAKFTFSYHSEDLIEPVTMTLTNIKPKADDARFRLNTDGTYTYTPAVGSGVSQEIEFVTTTSVHGAVSVSMKSKHHNPSSSSREKRYYNFTATLTLQNANEGRNQSAIKSTNDSTIDRDDPKITVNGEYDANDSISFSYTTTQWIIFVGDRTVTYKASATIQDLSDGEETISFKISR